MALIYSLLRLRLLFQPQRGNGETKRDRQSNSEIIIVSPFQVFRLRAKIHHTASSLSAEVPSNSLAKVSPYRWKAVTRHRNPTSCQDKIREGRLVDGHNLFLLFKLNCAGLDCALLWEMEILAGKARGAWRGVGRVAILSLLLTSCAKMQPRDVSGTGSRLEPEKYFAGHTRSWGVVEDRFGKVRRQFTGDLQGENREGVLHLEQSFKFSDGKTQQRSWRIRRLNEHQYEGTCDQVVGIVRGEANGNELRMKYTLAVPVGRRTTNLRFIQRMWLQDEDVLFNRVANRKFGLRLGTISEFFQKVPAAEP